MHYRRQFQDTDHMDHRRTGGFLLLRRQLPDPQGYAPSESCILLRSHHQALDDNNRHLEEMPKFFNPIPSFTGDLPESIRPTVTPAPVRPYSLLTVPN